jgi:hypothetical protein
MLPAFPRQQFDNSDVVGQLNRFVTALSQYWQRIINNAELDYVDVNTTALTGGANTQVAHKLGRKPVGWRITDIDAAATVYRAAAFDSSFLTLHASANCNVKLRVW